MTPALHHSRRQTILNAATSWGDMICQGVMGLLLVPLLISRLGKDGFGLICLLNVIVIYSSFADIGIRGALGRDLSGLAAQGDKRGFTTLLVTATAFLMAIAGVLTCAFYLFRGQIARILQIPGELMPTVSGLIPAYCGGMVTLGFLTPVFASALSAINRFDLTNIIRAAITLAGNLTLFLLLPAGGDAMVWWCGLVLATQSVLLAITFYAFIYYCRPLLSFVHFGSLTPLMSLMHFGGKVFGLTFAGMLGTQTDPLILSAYIGPGAVAIYNPATRVSAMIRPMVMVLAQTLYPVTTLHHTSHDITRLRNVLLKGTRYTMLLGALASVGVISLAKPFCKLWLGNAMGVDAASVGGILIFLALIDLVEYGAGTQWPVLIGQRDIDFLLWIQVPLTVVNIALSVLLVGFTDAGIQGVLIATLFVAAIRRPVVVWHTAARCDLRIPAYLSFSYAPAAVVMVLLALIAWLTRAFIPATSWTWLTVHAILLTFAWLPLSVVFGVTPEDRQSLGQSAKELVKRMSAFVMGA